MIKLLASELRKLRRKMLVKKRMEPFKTQAKTFASNPVAPTTFLQDFLIAPLQKPVAVPVTTDNSLQVWSALAEIGRQLEVLARAQTGQETFRVHTSPPLRSISPAPDFLTFVELVINSYSPKPARDARTGICGRFTVHERGGCVAMQRENCADGFKEPGSSVISLVR